jgi:hypothetical protein
VASTGIESAFLFAFSSLYSILARGRQDPSAKKSGATCSPKDWLHCDAMWSERQSKWLCKDSEKSEKSALEIIWDAMWDDKPLKNDAGVVWGERREIQARILRN